VALDRVEMFAQGLDHPEGIAILRDGTIFVGGEAGQIYRIDGDEPPREVANVGGFVLGIAADAEGTLYACSDALHSVFRVEPSTGRVERFASGLEDRPMRAPNWPAFDADGNLFVSDSGDWRAADGLIWVVRPGGRLEVWTEQSANFPNGLAVAPDGSRLLAVESYPGRIIEIPIDDDGSAGPRRVLCELGLTVPDGIAVADDGSLIVACYRPDVIYRWDRGDGSTCSSLIRRVRSSPRLPTWRSRATTSTRSSFPTWPPGTSPAGGSACAAARSSARPPARSEGRARMDRVHADLDRDRSIDERTADLLARMTLREKVGQLSLTLLEWKAYRRTPNDVELTDEFRDEVARFDGMGTM
jgi:gluconolactonase